MRSLLYCMLNGKASLARCSCRSGAIHHVIASLSRDPRPSLIFRWSGQRGGKRAGQHKPLPPAQVNQPKTLSAPRGSADTAHRLLKLRQKCGACLSNCLTLETGMVINNIHSSPHMIFTYDNAYIRHNNSTNNVLRCLKLSDDFSCRQCRLVAYCAIF